MKKYVKVQMVAKNDATGSYVAGCPTHEFGMSALRCKQCERVH